MPLAIDLFCGLGGWSEALLAEGYDVVGFDIERHRYPARVMPERETIKNGGGSWFTPPPGRKCAARQTPDGPLDEFKNAPLTGGWMEYPGQLVIQDVLTLHGSQFRAATLIVASPPCQEFSYMAMPWDKAKEKARQYRSGELDVADLTRLFDACFRIQREASEAAGHHIPMIVENVRGAQPWIGRARWNFGSFYLWGDVPALMPPVGTLRTKSKISCSPRLFSDRIAATPEEAHALHYKLPGFRFDGSGRSFQTASVNGTKNGNDWVGSGDNCSEQRRHQSNSPARKAASAMIAKIPQPLAAHIARTFL